ncbi:MAG TPA: GNAT family N-acetyltransferase [Longimicrobiaceae bacterium]|nr:GNAT family N-acetyltransferase [Longimicrobiaceae bacterium]
MESIRIAETDDDIRRCFPVVHQLRTHVVEGEFVPRVRRQMAGGFLFAMLEDEGEVRAAAGYRFIDNLFSGRILYVDDLVTDTTARSRGYGRKLLDWLIDRAREENCYSLELDSGVQRFDAHRFYLTNRMVISSHHFRLVL